MLQLAIPHSELPRSSILHPRRSIRSKDAQRASATNRLNPAEKTKGAQLVHRVAVDIGLIKAQTDQSSTVKPGTADRSLSLVTTVQLPRLRAIAAMSWSMVCIGRPRRLSSA